MTCPKCHNSEHVEGARFCMICGTPLKSCEGCTNENKSRDMDCCWNCSRNRLNTRKDLFVHRRTDGGERK